MIPGRPRCCFGRAFRRAVPFAAVWQRVRAAAHSLLLGRPPFRPVTVSPSHRASKIFNDLKLTIGNTMKMNASSSVLAPDRRPELPLPPV
eukprot:2512215-Pleurochrysis_carterae.AAC.1